MSSLGQDVHKRDVSYILSQLHDDIERTKKKYEGHPEKNEELKKELDKLISSADRDLRLKTQAIVRAKLTQSSVIPLSYSPQKSEKVNVIRQPQKQEIQRPKTALKKTTAVSPRKMNLPRVTPITPISTQRSPTSKNSRPKTSAVPRARSRKISDTVPHLQPVDWKDPTAPPPEIPLGAVDRYGVGRLLDSGYIKEQDVKSQLSGTLQVSQYRADFTIIDDIKTQHFVIDENNSKAELYTVENENTPSPEETEVIPQVSTPKRPLFYIANGEPVKGTEYNNFRAKNRMHWEQLENILKLIKLYCERQGIQQQRVDGVVLIEFCKMDPDEITDTQIIRCFVDPMPKERTKNIYGFEGPGGDFRAAQLIQSIWRGFAARRMVRRLMRNTTAAKIIQSWFRVFQQTRKFRAMLSKERRMVLASFDTLKYEAGSYTMDRPHVLVHLIDSDSAAELGRIRYLENQNTTLVLYLNKGLLSSVSEYITQLTHNDPNLTIISTHFKLPSTVPIEIMFSMDKNAIDRIRQIAQNVPIYVVPNAVSRALIDFRNKCDGVIFAPSPIRVQTYEGRMATHRLIESAGLVPFEQSNEILDKDSIFQQLADLAVTNPGINVWRLITNENKIAWASTSDFSLLEQLRVHKAVLTEEELEDPHFRTLLKANIQSEINHILQITTDDTPEEFIQQMGIVGGTIEAWPQHVKCMVSVSFFVPPLGSTQITGTWETLFLSAFEPFATIHPAFSVSRKKLKKHASKIAAECSSRRLIGTNVADFYYGTRTIHNFMNEETFKLSLTCDNVHIDAANKNLNELLAELYMKTSFDEESMSLGPALYVYVQPELILPYSMEMNVIYDRLQDNAMPVRHKIFLSPSIADPNTIALVVSETTPERLIQLTYRVLVCLAEDVFSLGENPGEGELWIHRYITSLEFVKSQVDSAKDLKSTALMTKTKAKKPQNEVRLFRFNKVTKENE